MAATLKIKNSSTPTIVPPGLTAGEMAVNLADKKLYIGGTGGTNVIFLDSTSSSVSSFNGITGAVTGVTVGGANTFTQLNTFSAGISAAGATFSKDITVNSVTVGRGGGNLDSNIAFGLNTLLVNTNGQSNVAIGANSLGNNTEGTTNIAIGGSVLNNNTTGSYNIAIGAGSMYWSTVSENNIAIGANVMTGSLFNIPGSYNTGIGNDALRSPGFTGESNVAIGYQASYDNTTGSYNVAIGFESLRNNSTGLYNTSVGSGALRHGNSITVVAGGSQMTALGYQAGRYRGTGTSSLTSGTGGIYIGYQARGSANTQTNEIVIGVDAVGLGSNTAVIGATLQSAATIYGVLNLPSGLSASGATFTGNISARNIVTSFNGATGAVTGVSSFNGATGAVTGASLGANTFTALNSFNAGISASGATFSAPITSTRMARHTSAALSAIKTASFTPTSAEDGTVFYINYSSKGTLLVTLDSLPIGWRAKFLNIGGGSVLFESNDGDVYGYGASNGLVDFILEVICIDTNAYFVG